MLGEHGQAVRFPLGLPSVPLHEPLVHLDSVDGKVVGRGLHLRTMTGLDPSKTSTAGPGKRTVRVG
jgi:hypothetical protein